MTYNSDAEEEIVEAIYRGACDADGLIHAVRLIGRYFDSAGVVLAELDKSAPNAPLMLGTRTVDQSFFTNYAPYAPFDPAPPGFAALPTGTVSTTERMCSSEFLKSNLFLNEFLRPLKIDTALGGPLLAHNGRFALISVLGATNRERFGPEDIARLERFTPHLRRALQIRRHFLNSRVHGQILESIVERNPAGIIALGSDGVPLFLNEAVRGMAAARDGLSLDRDGRLAVADRVAAARLTSFQFEALRGKAGGVVHANRPSGEPPYLVLVSPLPRTEDILSRTQRGVLLIVHDPNRRVATGAERIAQLLQVPLGAAKVIDALINGVELRDYAEREGISANTVKFHLKTAFDRTGTRSQLELLRRTILALDDLGNHLVDLGPPKGSASLSGEGKP